MSQITLHPLTAKGWAGVVFDDPKIPTWAPKNGQVHYYATDALQMDTRQVRRALFMVMPTGTIILDLGVYNTGEGHYLQVHTVFSNS